MAPSTCTTPGSGRRIGAVSPDAGVVVDDDDLHAMPGGDGHVEALEADGQVVGTIEGGEDDRDVEHRWCCGLDGDAHGGERAIVSPSRCSSTAPMSCDGVDATTQRADLVDDRLAQPTRRDGRPPVDMTTRPSAAPSRGTSTSIRSMIGSCPFDGDVTGHVDDGRLDAWSERSVAVDAPACRRRWRRPAVERS